MLNLEKWYRWTHFQGSNRDAEVKNRLGDTEREGESGTNWDIRMDIYALPLAKEETTSAQQHQQ